MHRSPSYLPENPLKNVLYNQERVYPSLSGETPLFVCCPGAIVNSILIPFKDVLYWMKC